MVIDASPYPRVEGLHSLIRRINFGERPVQARGRFDVRHGSSPLARIIVRLLRMPAEGQSVPLTLTIVRRGNVDVWRRSFGRRSFTTLQRRGVWPPIERFGPLELAYKAEVTANALSLRSASARMCVGPVAWTLPARLSPRDTVLVVGDGERAVRVHVAVELPIVGLLLEYEGMVEEAR